MTTDKYLSYRGQLQAVTACGGSLAFVTAHPESVPTALYRLDPTKLELSEIVLECGGLCLLADEESLWLGGDNGRLYQLPPGAKALQALSAQLPAAATALARLSSDRLAALCTDHLAIVDTKRGKLLQSLELPERGVSLAASPDGQWLAVGTSKGRVLVFDCEQKDEFLPGESEKLHDGAVTALLFEPEELRFFSAGADQKLLLTHARGKLEPEDRGRGASHSDHVTAMLLAPGERFITGSRDKSCKTWARAGATRPATVTDGVPAVVDAALIEIHERPHLVLAGADNTLRLLLIDAGGRFGALTHRLHDAYDRAAQLLKDKDVGRRGEALHALAGYDDIRSIDMLAQQVEEDADHSLRLRATELLAKSRHPRAAVVLAPLLKHRDDKVRMTAWEGLRAATDKSDLRPLQLAIDSKQANIGVAAVSAMEPLAKKDDHARQLLIQTLSKDPPEVRRAALLTLERVFAKNSPEPTLIAAKSRQADTRRLAMIRCYQRGLLDDTRVQAAIRRCGEDRNPDVRRTSFLVSLLSSDKLTQAVRQRDKQLHRQLFELESFEVEPAARAEAKEPPAPKPSKAALSATDYQPLLSAMSARVTDVCLLGARCLALLGDSRALGTLLQLSRDEETSARVQVCQALAALQDHRAVQRLETLLDDRDAAVRDAAYSALAKIHAAQPLDAAEAGFGSANADVRRRGLQTLWAALRKAKAKSAGSRGGQLLLRALNDGDERLRGEAFKSTLSLNIAGDAPQTLRFVLNSVHASVRREVLTEVMAQDKQPWAAQLLREFLNDPSADIRRDAYDYLLQQTKGRDVAPMQAGLESRHVDIRKRATASLVQLNTSEAQQSLLLAIEDEDREVRGAALEALVRVNAVDVLHQAMESRFADVRLQSACARALFHDGRAVQPLLTAATTPEPEKKSEQQEWQRQVVLALSGLGLLGDAEFVPQLMPLLDSSHGDIRQAAARAVSRCARPDQAETLKAALQHADKNVRYRIALGLAFCQDPVALPVVFSPEAESVLQEKHRLMAAVAYGEQTESRLVALLDSAEDWIANAAFLLLLMRDWRAHDGTPARVLGAMAAEAPRIRLAAAGALERFADPAAFADYVIAFFNDRGQQRPWQVSAEIIRTIADVCAFAPPHCQAAAAALFQHLDEKEQDSWDFQWSVFAARYARDISAAGKLSESAQLPKTTADADELSQLAFGAYVGLVREQGGYHGGSQPAFGSSVVGVRQAALRRLAEMAQDASLLPAVRPVLIQALGDPLQDVRTLAFAALGDLGMDTEQRAEAAIECGHRDLGAAGLKLLTESAGKQGRKILEDVVAARDDELAYEAAVLLKDAAGLLPAAKTALESPHQPTREFAVQWLADAYEQDTGAGDMLAGACDSRHAHLRQQSAIALAARHDPRAFDTLLGMLKDPAADQLRAINALVELGDPRTPDALLDRIEEDPNKTADASSLFRAAGSFRQVETAARLLKMLEHKPWQNPAAAAAIQISGYDQACHNAEDELPDRRWLERQHPRHDDVLSAIIERALELGLATLIRTLIPNARWALTPAADAALALLVSHPDDEIRNRAAEAVGWRLRKREGSAEPLIKLLEHRDTTTKFIAAAGLARAGRDDGINILLSAVELMSDLRFRMAAVEALGELADERSLELLLKLASDDAHALQQPAAAAIGHLGKSDRAEEIFQLLKRLAQSHGSVAEPAVVGLRWLNTAPAWDLIRQQALEGKPYQETLLRQLGYNDDPATRALLLKILSGGAWSEAALIAARKVFGNESLEPDYAAVRAASGYEPSSPVEDQHHCLQRVCEQGEPARVFEILPDAVQCQSELRQAMLERDPPPLEAAAAALDSPHARAVQVAAHVIGRHGGKPHVKPLAAAIRSWLGHWSKHREQMRREQRESDQELTGMTDALVWLAWAAGGVGAAKAELLELLGSHPADQQFSEVRRMAVQSLARLKLGKTDLKGLTAALEDSDAAIRQAAAAALARQAPEQTATLAAQMISDRQVFNRLTSAAPKTSKKVQTDAGLAAALESGARHPHYQSVVLPQLVAAGDVDCLASVAADGELQENTRIGAVEGLARIASAAGDQQLVRIGNDKQAGEELRKAAWRGLRRSKRQQAAKESGNG